MYKAAIQDITESFLRWRLWFYLAWFEVKLSYRGSLLGPFWITISMAVFVAVLSIVYGRLFHQDIKSYLPFLLCGFLNWYLISNIVNNSGRIFINSANFITQMKMPFLLHILKNNVKELIIYAHNFLVYVILIIILQLNPGWTILLAIPGILLVMLNLVWVSLLIGMIASRFRDIPPIVISVVQVAFFISPITWMPKLIGEDSIIIKWNPITYALQVARDPLLGLVPPWYSWAILIGLFLFGCAIAFPFFARYRQRLPFWVL